MIYKKNYIAALLHNPNVLRDVFVEDIDIKSQSLAKKAIVLLVSSYTSSKNEKISTITT